MSNHNVSRHVYFPAFNGVRSFAAQAVLFSHLGLVLSAYLIGTWAVVVFLVLSAFLLGGILIQQQKMGMTFGQSWGRFFWKREIRLFFAYTVTLFCVWAIFGAPYTAWPYMFYLQGVYTYFSGEKLQPELQHTWSLAVEALFYLILPGTLFLCYRIHKNVFPVVCVMATIVSLVWNLLYFLAAENEKDFYHFDLMICLAPLALGALLAHFYHHYEVQVGGEKKSHLLVELAQSRVFGLVQHVFEGLLIVYVLLCFVAPEEIQWWHKEMWCLHLIFPVGTIFGLLVVICAIVNPPKILMWRPVAYIGKISYGVYLYHYPLFLYIDRLSANQVMIPGWLKIVIKLTGAILIAHIGWKLLEQPMTRRWRNMRWPRSGAAGITKAMVLMMKFRPFQAKVFGVPVDIMSARLGGISAVLALMGMLVGVSVSLNIPDGSTSLNTTKVTLNGGHASISTKLIVFDSAPQYHMFSGEVNWLAGLKGINSWKDWVRSVSGDGGGTVAVASTDPQQPVMWKQEPVFHEKSYDVFLVVLAGLLGFHPLMLYMRERITRTRRFVRLLRSRSRRQSKHTTAFMWWLLVRRPGLFVR